ncbi:MAG: hypothetical protein JWQ13_3012 [Ramlibacter sp.]|jgi:hypothetical protein|nr:hypothetical protein [Ramlibacter sp.]
MSEQQNYGFGKFVPGFDFLQNLAKGASQTSTAIPSLSSWVAPTLSVEELDKRIGELKAVSFWLDQNARALGATIQALELQKMTLATLKGMNFNMAQVAEALKLKPGADGAAAPDAQGAEPASDSVASAAREAVAKARAGKKNAQGGDANGEAGKTASVVDPLQWWGALTQQFQEIAAGAMREAAANPAVEVAREIAGGVTTQTMKAANDLAVAATGKVARKSGAAAKKTSATGKSAGAKKTARKTGVRNR